MNLKKQLNKTKEIFSMKQYLLGVDNGGTSTKAAIFSLDGNEIAVSTLPTPQIIPEAGWAERDMNVLWNTTAKVIKEAIKKAGISGGEIACVGCTGHGKGLYMKGKDGANIYNAIASTDSRAASIITEWQNDGTVARASELNCQRVIACQPVALLAWLKRNMPNIYSQIGTIFEAKDYIRFMLTGEAFAEMTDISGTGLLNLHTRSYDSALLDMFGIPEIAACLPPLALSTDVCGHVTKKASAETGLAEGTPVCGGMFDIDACAVAMDVTDEDSICAITGTWSINEYLSKTTVKPDSTTLNSLFCIPEYYLIEESSPTSAGNLEWIIAQFMEGKYSADTDIYAKVNALVESTPPADSGIIFLPFLYGTNVPHITEGALIGLNSACGLPQILRAVFEGVVFSHKYHIDKLLSHREEPLSIRLSGGAAKSEVWTQMFADILGLPVEVIGVRELGTLGCCMAGAVAAGIYDSYKSAAAAMTGEIRKVYPNTSLASIYTAKYHKYLRALGC